MRSLLRRGVSALLLIVVCAPLRADEHMRHDATSHHSFADVEEWTTVFDDPFRDSWQKPAEVVAALGLRPGMCVADLGAGTGYFSRRIAADLPVLVALALRCVNEHGAYYGMDLSLPGERAFTPSIFGAASSPTLAAKQVAMAQISKLGVMIAKKATWEELERLGLVVTIKKIAESLGIRLTKDKLGQVVPVVGALVGGGVNAWFVDTVAETSYMLYRERFLIAKYGPGVAVPVR